jgi:SAM-dependent methyltransferase
MSHWTAGYVADIGYTYGYYTELNPHRIDLAFLNAGLAVPEYGTACELGFGQGVSANVHAAATVTQWHGTDFNPAQAGFAQELAQASGADVALFDEAFDAFCSRDDLPEFDYIGLHGIWSWISDENRQVIVDFVRRKLKVGGVLYISYNTQPGWAAMVPMRDLLTEHASVMSADGAGIVSKIDNALAFADQLMAANPKYALANPQIKDRIEKIKEQNRHYVAHEYFNRDWEPMSFAKMADWLEPAKVQWACSANYLDAVDAVNLTADQQALLNGIPDPMFRQSVRDFCVNQQFRKDYWVKGARKLSALEQAEQLRAQRFILAVPREGVSLKVTGSLGEANLQEAIYGPILDVLADHKVRSLGQIEQELKVRDGGQAITFSQLLQAAIVLSSNGTLASAQDEAVVQNVKKKTARLNRHLMLKARAAGEIAYLASPVTGGGVSVPRFQQLFLLARENGGKTPKDWAKFVFDVLALQGQQMRRDGKVIDAAEDQLSLLAQMAEEFAAKQLPILRALKVA